MNLQALLDPTLAKTLPPLSRQRALCSLALRALWHQIYDPCPTLLALSPPDGKSLLEAFLLYARQTRLNMDWKLHLELWDWLPLSGYSLNEKSEEVRRELYIAAAAHWTVSDRSLSQSLLLKTSGEANETIWAIKSWSLKESRKVRRLTGELRGLMAPDVRISILSREETESVQAMLRSEIG